MTIVLGTAVFILGFLLGRFVTAREWREHCRWNDSRWMEYHEHLVREDRQRMRDEHLK